jgi:hypothetical protein
MAWKATQTLSLHIPVQYFKKQISQIHQIGMEYSIIKLIRWAHSAINIQCSCRQVRLIRIEYSMVGLNAIRFDGLLVYRHG